jgi:hypothetical protein
MLIRNFIIMTGLILSLASCAKLETVDKSLVNHEAMDLTKDMTDQASAAFTTLSGSGGGAAGCAT